MSRRGMPHAHTHIQPAYKHATSSSSASPPPLLRCLPRGKRQKTRQQLCVRRRRAGLAQGAGGCVGIVSCTQRKVFN